MKKQRKTAREENRNSRKGIRKNSGKRKCDPAPSLFSERQKNAVHPEGTHGICGAEEKLSQDSRKQS